MRDLLVQPDTVNWQAFDCETEPLPPNTLAPARSPARARQLDLSAPCAPPSLQLFDCETVELPAGTLAAPRPPGKERRLSQVDADTGRVEQKVVSLSLSSGEQRDQQRPIAEHFSEYIADGWKVKQLTSLSTGGAHGWIVVLLERTLI